MAHPDVTLAIGRDELEGLDAPDARNAVENTFCGGEIEVAVSALAAAPLSRTAQSDATDSKNEVAPRPRH